MFPDLTPPAQKSAPPMTVYSESYRDATRASVMEVVTGSERAIGYLANMEEGDEHAVASLLLFTSNGGGDATVEHPLPSATVNTSVRDLLDHNPAITDAIDSGRPSARIALTRGQCIELADTLLVAAGFDTDLPDSNELLPSPELYVCHGEVTVEC